MRFVFLGKNHRLPFFQNFPCEVKVLGACDHKAVVELDSFFMTNCCFLCETSVYLNCLEQKILPVTAFKAFAPSEQMTWNLCSRTLTTCASVATYSISVTSNLCSRTLTTCASVATYLFSRRCQKRY
jgi:hypothetical protein